MRCFIKSAKRFDSLYYLCAHPIAVAKFINIFNHNQVSRLQALSHLDNV